MSEMRGKQVVEKNWFLNPSQESLKTNKQFFLATLQLYLKRQQFLNLLVVHRKHNICELWCQQWKEASGYKKKIQQIWFGAGGVRWEVTPSTTGWPTEAHWNPLMTQARAVPPAGLSPVWEGRSPSGSHVRSATIEVSRVRRAKWGRESGRWGWERRGATAWWEVRFLEGDISAGC